MIDARSFIETMAGVAREADEKSSSRIPRLATIDPGYTSGAPQVILDGSTNVSPGGLPVLAGYSPKAGDRVILLPVGNTYVVLGSPTSAPDGVIIRDRVNGNRYRLFTENGVLGTEMV